MLGVSETSFTKPDPFLKPFQVTNPTLDEKS